MKEPLKLSMDVTLTDASNKKVWSNNSVYENLKYNDVVIMQKAVSDALVNAGADKGNLPPGQGDIGNSGKPQ